MKIKFTQSSQQRDNSIIALIIAGSLALTALVAIHQSNIEAQKQRNFIEFIGNCNAPTY